MVGLAQLRWHHALEAYADAAKIAPQPSLALQRESDLQFRLARFRGGDPVSSEEPLMEALRLGADEGWTLYRLGAIAEFSVHAKAPARVLYQAAAQVLPGSTRILVALGHTLLRAGRYDDAVAVFARAVSIDSSLMPRLFRDVRRVTTNNSLLRRLLPPGELEAHVELARLFEQTGLVPAALSEFETLFDATSPPAWVHVEFARLLARSGRTEMAISRLNELSRWSSIGPQERIEILTLLGSLESNPEVRFRRVSEAFTLLGPADLDPATMKALLQPLADDPARQQALLDRALAQLEAASSLRPALIRQRQEELRRVQAELTSSPK
jgi:tetratricopeptide (TPR) repeat protein